VLTPPAILVSSYIVRPRLVTKEHDFLKKWGCFFNEFKNNAGFWSTQFYFVYFTRRLSYALAQVYLNHALFVQGALNIAGSALQTLFVLHYLPFNEKSILLSNVVGELGTILVVILTYVFLFDISNSTAAILEQAAIYTILGTMATQFAVSIYSTLKALAYMWKKINKVRALAFSKNANPIITLATP
jgi:hypothetical protein